MLSNEKYPTNSSCLSDDKRPYDKLITVDLSTTVLAKEPSFSIRDYVFITRNNNYVNNWPFSQNNRQLCLDHGVKDLLPPFQSPVLVRNLIHAQDNVESVLINNNRRFDSIKEPSDSSNHLKIIKPVKNPLKEPSKVPMSSEAVAVCPVCRTFSSSSNTTLNAHIDQCLSGEYTLTKSIANPKMNNRHRIKPRKIRLMVDIYKTAPYCTLEELDRRNGSKWASNFTLSPPKGFCLNVKETTTSGDSSIYVDSNGTKVRILSKFSNPKNSKLVDIPERRKLLKGGERSMGFLGKKIKKQKKCLKLYKYDKKQIINGQDGIISHKEIDEKDESMEKKHKASDQVKFIENTKGWLRINKRDMMKKKINGADDKTCSRECIDGDSLSKRGLSSLATNSHVKKFSDLKFPNINSPDKNGRNDTSSSSHKRVRSLMESELSHGRKISLVFHDQGVKDTSEYERPVKMGKIHARNSVSNPIISRKFSSFSKKHSSAPDSRFSPKEKFSAIKKFKVFTASDSDEEETPSHSGPENFSRKFNEEETGSEDSYDRNVALKVRSSRKSIVSREEEEEDVIALKSSQSTSMYSNHDPDNVEQKLSEVAVGGFLGLPGHFIYDAEAEAENVCVMVDQIPIPGPPGSFLPSPRHMDSDDLQGNSSLTSTRVQSHDDHQDFADHSSESHASNTSTISNSNIQRSGSEPFEKLPIGPPKNVVICASTNVDSTCQPKTKLNIALTEIPSTNHPCCCSRKDVLLQNVSPLLLTRTMGSIFSSSCGPNGTLDNSNSSSSVIRTVQGDDCIAGIVSSSVYNDNEQSNTPAPSTPVLRLMGKNLMVINKDEGFHTVPQTFKAGLHHPNNTLSNVYGNYEHSGTPTSVTNLAVHMDQSTDRDFTGSLAGFMLKSDPRNTSPFCETQEYVYGRPVVRSLVNSTGLVQVHPNGANSEHVKWNSTLETSNTSLNTSFFPGGPFRFE